MERNIKAISNFIFISDKLSKSDIIIVPGTFRIGIVDKALEVYNKGLADYIVTTGGVRNEEGVSESEFQRQYLIDHGVPEGKILHESKSTNTKENAIYAREVIDSNNLKFAKIILISKTYHSRRILMTFIPSFEDSDIKIADVVDERNITKDNWSEDEDKTNKVLEEIEKIGRYFLKGDLSI